MDEFILFNPGDAIAHKFDFQEALRSAEIYKQKKHKSTLVVVNDQKTPEYFVFTEADQKNESNQPVQKYTLKKRV